MRKKIIIDAMGKRITIDNPSNVTLVFPENPKPFMFKLNVDEKFIRKILSRLGGR